MRRPLPAIVDVSLDGGREFVVLSRDHFVKDGHSSDPSFQFGELFKHMVIGAICVIVDDESPVLLIAQGPEGF
jgi:hypothetical protein